MRVGRRGFVLASAALATLAASRLARAQEREADRAADGVGPDGGGAEPLRLLVLGGTGFLGPHVVERAVERGHRVTLFNRGRTNPHLFPDLEKLRGDRDGDLGALEGRSWDAVLDTSAYVPRIVHLSAGLLKDAVRHYVLISTISVYARLGEEDVDEQSPVATLEDEATETVDGATYGALKALCERAAEEEMPGRVAAVRPGLIVGPGDPTDRFTYWPARIAEGGEVLAPVGPDELVSYVDVRDLAAWLVHVVERRVTGTYNANGDPVGLGRVLEACVQASASDARLTWVDRAHLERHGVQPWSDLPLWVPAPEGGTKPRIANRRAVSRGLALRPVADTVEATLAWHRERGPDHRLRAGLSREREAEVLAAWHEARRDG